MFLCPKRLKHKVQYGQHQRHPISQVSLICKSKITNIPQKVLHTSIGPLNSNLRIHREESSGKTTEEGCLFQDMQWMPCTPLNGNIEADFSVHLPVRETCTV